MKKLFLFSVLLSSALFFTSCKVNWFDRAIDVPWYYIAIPIALLCIFGYKILMSKTYICPYCKTEFKAKPHQLYVAFHKCGKRYAKCPNCERKGFFKVKK